MRFWSKIKKKYNVSDEEIRKVLKCTSKRLAKLEDGTIEMTTDDLMRLCQGLNISGDEIADIILEDL